MGEFGPVELLTTAEGFPAAAEGLLAELAAMGLLEVADRAVGSSLGSEGLLGAA